MGDMPSKRYFPGKIQNLGTKLFLSTELFMGAHETIIHRLVMKNQIYDDYFPFLITGSFLAGKWACPPRASKPD